MPKKTFKDSTSHLDRFFSDTNTEHRTDNAPMPQNTQRTVDAPPTANTSAKYYRLNLKLKAEYKEYLEHVSWQNHQSVTKYLSNLIEADMATKNT